MREALLFKMCYFAQAKIHPSSNHWFLNSQYNGIFYVAELLKREVLTPNRNGFMAKARYCPLKAGGTVVRVQVDTCG